MFLALAELRRAKVRFGLLMAAIGLLVFLILFQQTLQEGLLRAFVGALRNQSAPVLVYSVEGQRVLQASVIPASLEEQVRAVDGSSRAGRIGQGTFTVMAGGDLLDAAIIGYEDERLGAPTTLTRGRLPRRTGEAVASEADADRGFDVGDVVRVEPGGLTIAVVGVARDINLNASPTLFTSYATYLDAALSRNPDAAVPPPSAIAVQPVPGTTADHLVALIDAAVPDAEALTRGSAADQTPGVVQVRRSFSVILLLYGSVVPLVTGLFFLIVTLQKAAALTLLHAVGIPARRLVRSLLAQTVIVVGVGIALGLAAYIPLSRRRVGDLALRFETGPVVQWAAVLVVLGVVSSFVAALRVLRIDPIEATTGAGRGS